MSDNYNIHENDWIDEKLQDDTNAENVKESLKQKASKAGGSKSRFDSFPIMLACLTTAVSIFIGKLVVPLIDYSISQDETLVILDQPYWEHGTLAFTQFKQPEITRHDGYFQFRVKTQYLENFEVSSFINHKFSLNENRVLNFEVMDPDKRNHALIMLTGTEDEQIYAPEKFMISSIEKDEGNLYFRIHWDSKQQQTALTRLVNKIAQNPEIQMNIIYDFIENNSFINQHTGILSHGGSIKKQGDDYVFEIELNKSHTHFNDRETMMYLQNAGVMNQYVFWDNPRFENFEKVMEWNGGNENQQVSHLFDEINDRQPDILFFSKERPIKGHVKSITINDNVLRIVFHDKRESSFIVLDRQMPYHVLLNTVPDPYDVKKKEQEKVIASKRQTAKSNADDLDLQKIEAFSEDLNNIGYLSTENINFEKSGDKYLLTVLSKDVNSLRVYHSAGVSIFDNNNNSTSGVLLANEGDMAQALHVQFVGEDQSILLKGCIKITHMSMRNNLFISAELVYNFGNGTYDPLSGHEKRHQNYFLIGPSLCSNPYWESYLIGQTISVERHKDELVFFVPIKKGENGFFEDKSLVYIGFKELNFFSSPQENTRAYPPFENKFILTNESAMDGQSEFTDFVVKSVMQDAVYGVVMTREKSFAGDVVDIRVDGSGISFTMLPVRHDEEADLHGPFILILDGSSIFLEK